MGLRRVFDHCDAVGTRRVQDGIHVGGLSIQVDWDNRLGFRSDGGFQLARIEIVGFGIDIDIDRSGTSVENCRDRGDKSKRRSDDLVAGSDSGGEQRQVQSAGPGVHADRLGIRTVGGKLFLEAGYFRSERELAAFENARDGGIDLRLDAVVLRLQVSVRNHD